MTIKGNNLSICGFETLEFDLIEGKGKMRNLIDVIFDVLVIPGVILLSRRLRVTCLNVTPYAVRATHPDYFGNGAFGSL